MLREREAAARAIARSIASELRQRGAEQILLIGSLARGDFRASSDVDLAVRGLDANVLSAVEASWTDRSGLGVDLLRIEEMRPAWRAYHERFGEPLHG